jgi:hypothetical protein
LRSGGGTSGNWSLIPVDTHTHTGSQVSVGTTANLPLKTGTNGVIEAGSFGTSAGTFCEGNDARLSDARNPTSHAASHAAGGTDELFDQDLNTTDVVGFAEVQSYGAVSVGNEADGTPFYRAIFANTTATDDRVLTLPDASGTIALVGDAPASHTHVVADVTGAAASGSITTSGLTQATARILGRTTASTGAIEEIQIGSGLSLSAGELSATSSGGISAVGASTADVLSVSGSDLVADDPNADRIVFWDDSEGKLRYLEAGSGLSISGTTMTATASGGSKTYAVFTAEHNQPPATAFATLDTRNSIAVLDFDDATDESAVFVSIIPEAASLGSGLKIRLHWMATTATSGNVVWDVSLERMTTDLDSDSFDTIASGTAAANGTSGILTVTEITLTTIDSVTAGDGYRLKVTRDANNASDTMTGDAELVVCEVRSAA